MILFSYFNQIKCFLFPPGFQSFSEGEALCILKIWLEFSRENDSVFVFQSNKALSFSPVFSIIFKRGDAAHFEELARIFAGK